MESGVFRFFFLSGFGGMQEKKEKTKCTLTHHGNDEGWVLFERLITKFDDASFPLLLDRGLLLFLLALFVWYSLFLTSTTGFV